MNTGNNRWKISHFVLIGLMVVIYAAVIYGVGMLTSVTIPIMPVLAESCRCSVCRFSVSDIVKGYSHLM